MGADGECWPMNKNHKMGEGVVVGWVLKLYNWRDTASYIRVFPGRIFLQTNNMATSPHSTSMPSAAPSPAHKCNITHIMIFHFPVTIY